MNHGALLRANTRQTLTRFRALLGTLALGMALLTASAAVAGGSIAADAHALDSASGLSTLELLSVSPSGTPKQLTQAAVASIGELDGVDAAMGGGSVGSSLSYIAGGESGAAGAAEQAFAGVFWAMPRFAWSQPPMLDPDGKETSRTSLSEGEILLPSTYLDTDLGLLIGAEVALEYTVATGKDEGASATMPLRVVGVYDNDSPKRAGDSAVYLAETDFTRTLAALQGAPGRALPRDFAYPSCWVKTSSVARANSLARELTKDGYYVNQGGSESALPGALLILQQTNTILAVLLALFGVGIGVTISGTWSNLRRWDVGVLASLGWSPVRVLAVYTAEVSLVGLLVGVLASLLGTILSVGASFALRSVSFLGLQLSPGSWPPPAWVFGMVVGAPLVMALGAAPRIIGLGRLEPDDALRRPD